MQGDGVIWIVNGYSLNYGTSKFTPITNLVKIYFLKEYHQHRFSKCSGPLLIGLG